MSFTLLVVASIVILPFLTYYTTSTLFIRRSNSKLTGKEPPTIPYFVPGLFSAAAFAQLGARRYFAELIKDYGAFAPFRVRAGLRSYVVLRDPTHMRRVLEAKDHLTTRAARVEMSDKLFGSPDADSHSHKSEARNHEEAKESLPNDGCFHISDAALTSSIDIYISILSANMHDKMFQYDTWTRIEDLWSFFQLVIVRCTIQTLFGSVLLKQYPRMVRDYIDFNAATEGFVSGMPRVMVSSAAKPRDRLLEGMKNWVPMGRGESDTDETEQGRESATVYPTWDEKTGLLVVREHINQCHSISKRKYYMLKGTAAEVLGITHATSTELLSSTFWTTIETLRKSHLTRNMTATIAQHFSPIIHKYDVLGLVQDPGVRSLQTEVRRLRTAACVMRTNETDGFPLDKQWSLPKGATVAMFSHDIALNTDVWKKAQPRALERPLEEFWAERFTLPEQSRNKRPAGVEETNESDAGEFGDLIMTLTACDQFPGSRFISAMQTATLAVIFAEFEIQLSDAEEVDAVLPPLRAFAYGTVKPLDKIAVRVRKRRT
ncbi:uncharacterized protein M421DRAFT_64809 [Didymella exigua CBS 183.55]|uniref:Cytochrome P450 n=1 Tax=Didymella exigua CBS 183.55 TaxID=1150837 RepID=A0A6A5RMI8_9PLEO|nr:uncharacterized protein M421DRAFT_64809 [Didymella exigua CBS 183.55]KAF1927586.1 hypothetical protein M421DRAFT_64809 [Didymella exigua CBS 183.55]